MWPSLTRCGEPEPVTAAEPEPESSTDDEGGTSA